jgi:uncharacterized membrane protein YvbJ
MKREDDQELWDILGHAAEPGLSPFFARNVLRRIRQKSGRFEWMRKSFSLRRLIPASALAIAVIGTIIATHHSVLQQSPESEPDVVAKIDPQDYEVVADLDELLVLDENNLWDGKPTL